MNIRTILQFTIGPMGVAFLGLITLPLMTWMVSVDSIGKLSMLQVTVSFSVLFFSLGLDQAFIREYHEANQQERLFWTSFLPGLMLFFFVSVSFLFKPILLSSLS